MRLASADWRAAVLAEEGPRAGSLEPNSRPKDRLVRALLPLWSDKDSFGILRRAASSSLCPLRCFVCTEGRERAEELAVVRRVPQRTPLSAKSIKTK
jgi:hypothetical protein